jgi:hypothetical protein
MLKFDRLRRTPVKPWRVLCRAIVIAILLGACSCTHGPPQLQVKILNAQFKPGTGLIAVAMLYQKHRLPTGFINTFPNGGVPKVLVKEARVYLCDTHLLTVKKLVSFAEPSHLKNGFSPWIAGWKEDAIVLRLTGRAGTSLADYEAGINEEIHLVDMQGNITPIQEVPKMSSTPEPKDAPRLFTEHDTVEVGAVGNVVFHIDPADGELTAYHQ